MIIYGIMRVSGYDGGGVHSHLFSTMDLAIKGLKEVVNEAIEEDREYHEESNVTRAKHGQPLLKWIEEKPNYWTCSHDSISIREFELV